MDVNPVQNNPSSNPVPPPPITPPTPVAPPPPPPVTPPASPNPLSSSPSQPSSPLNPPASPPPEKPKSHKKLIALALLLVLAVALPLTVFVSRQPQTIEQEAEEPQLTPETVMFEIEDESFSLQNIIDVAKEQYNEADAKTPEVQRIAKDILIEREILDRTAEELSLSVTDEERTALMEISGLSQNEAYYELLRGKVILEKVRWMKAISIGYWVPPPGLIQEDTVEQRQQVSAQISAGESAINQVQNSLGSVQNPLTLAKNIATNNPELEEIIAVNGYKLSSITAEEEDLISEPELYEYNDSNFDDDTRNTLFAQNVTKNQVITVGKNDSNGGETVYKIIEISNSGVGSYEEWLKGQKEALVDKEIPL